MYLHVFKMTRRQSDPLSYSVYDALYYWVMRFGNEHPITCPVLIQYALAAADVAIPGYCGSLHQRCCCASNVMHLLVCQEVVIQESTRLP